MIFRTSGKGLWSDRVADVKITDIVFLVDYAEVRVYFDVSSWNTETDGLIYTDDQFVKDVNQHIQTRFNGCVCYSEQGMQGDDYVSFDMNQALLNSVVGTDQ